MRVVLEDRDLDTVRDPVRVLELLLAEMGPRLEVDRPVELSIPVSVEVETAVDVIVAD